MNKNPIFLIIVFLIGGCGLKNGPQVQKTDSGAGVHGVFQAQEKLDGSDTSRYNIGCIYPGKYSPKNQIDDRVKVGQKFRTHYWFLTYEKPLEEVFFEESIHQLTSNSLSSSTNVLSKVLYNEYPVGPLSSKVCAPSTPGDVSTLKCKTEYKAAIMEGTRSETCAITETSSISEYHRGIFVFGYSGEAVLAYRQTATLKGKVACENGVDLGEGTLIRTVIFSNDVPSRAHRQCGGVEIVDAVEGVTDKGVRFVSYGDELTGY